MRHSTSGVDDRDCDQTRGRLATGQGDSRNLIIGRNAAMAFSALAMLAAGNSAVAAPPTPFPAAGQNVPIGRETFDRMTIPVRLAGLGPYRFMLDTGSDRTSVSRELAETLGLPIGIKVKVHSLVGASKVATATLKDLQIAEVKARNGSIEAPLLASRNMGADGILGTDTLQSRRVDLDFDAGTMAIVPSASHNPATGPGSIVVEARRRNGRLIITDASIAGQHVTIVVDTGAQVTVANEALHEKLLRLGAVGFVEPAQLESVTGSTINGQYAVLNDVEIQGIKLHGLAVVFAPAHTFEQLNLGNRPALLLGMNALRLFKKVSMDFSNGSLRVVLPE